VYAADIDPKALINTEKISSFECDQLDAISIKNLWSKEKLKNLEFDIMILDGVHTFDGNMFFLSHSIHKLKHGGICVIEDIHEYHIASYQEKIDELKYWLPTFEISLLDLHKSNEKVSDNSLMVLYKK
jgi:predicted methyltransferase